MTEPKWKRHWPEFSEKMQKRLQAGFEEYGDVSFSRDPLELIGELREEVQDIAGWSVILDARLRVVEDALRREDASE